MSPRRIWVNPVDAASVARALMQRDRDRAELLRQLDAEGQAKLREHFAKQDAHDWAILGAAQSSHQNA